MDDIERAISVALLSKAARVVAEQQAFIDVLMGELVIAEAANAELLSIAEEIGSDLESADEEFDILENFVSSITGAPVDKVFEYFVLPHLPKPVSIDIETRGFDDGGPYNGSVFFASSQDESLPDFGDFFVVGEVDPIFSPEEVSGLPDAHDWRWLTAAVLEKAEDGGRFNEVQANFWIGFINELRN